ncbi:amidase [Domibacillus robiginosus]|uniref:amidase n=1 Tax=Domibacillus robiginosus TaxID=1071054 RepID=UPI00067B8349|nr:amidase [Domibacillus robiginosus]
MTNGLKNGIMKKCTKEKTSTLQLTSEKQISPSTSRYFRKKSSWILSSLLTLGSLTTGIATGNPVSAVTNVPASNNATWQIQDAAPPGLDTGSIRALSQSQVQGFGNIFVKVSTTPEPRLNGEMMRGFGLQFDGKDTFETTQAVNLGGIHITREVKVATGSNWTRFFDTFTNTSKKAVIVDVSFGGALGYGAGSNHAAIKSTSDGNQNIDKDDTWSLMATSDTRQRPVGVVIGKSGSLERMGNQERNPFDTPMAESGNESNFFGFVDSLTIKPGETKSLARFVLAGTTGATAEEKAVKELISLSSNPDFSDLSTEEICSLDNWNVSKLSGLEAKACPSVNHLNTPPPGKTVEPYTTSRYDVVNKSIAEMQRDMEKGVTTSEEITRAYLDRIAVYDSGQFGFNAFIHVADDAIKQAKAADRARKKGENGELLGIPIAIKDLFDTKDMPTTGGTLALEGWQPDSDAYQVAKLRESGAVLIGKTNLSEFANSGGYSESGWGQVWNALYPSKTSFGSSGGSAVAVAASMAAGSLGTQTGVSLYAPSVGASLTTFRGTDGMASTSGVIPLTWGQDYAGPIARTVTDLAYLLNATTGTDPLDMLTTEADSHRPDDWTAYLDENSLAGKRIGYIPSSFVSSYADDGTGEAAMEHFADIEAAGGTMVEMKSPPGGGSSPGGSRNIEGWARYIELHNDFPYKDGNTVLASPRVLPYNQQQLRDTPRMTSSQVDAWLQYRANYKQVIAQWMADYDVDAVVYPGFISDMYNNDGASNQHTADRATGVLTSNVGLPTVVVPVGTNSHGYSISMQLVGTAWNDAQILGMGYALEQQAQGQQLSNFAPRLEYQSKRPQHSYEKGRPSHSYQTGRPAHANSTGRLSEKEYNE